MSTDASRHSSYRPSRWPRSLKDDVESRVEAARQAAETLAAEAGRLQELLLGATASVRHAATSVIVADLEELAREVETIECEATRSRARFHAALELWLADPNGKPAPIPVSEHVAMV